MNNLSLLQSPTAYEHFPATDNQGASTPAPLHRFLYVQVADSSMSPTINQYDIIEVDTKIKHITDVANMRIDKTALGFYSVSNSLKSWLHTECRPESVDFLRLMISSLGRVYAYLKQFSMGDGARNTIPFREITPLDCVTSFEPLPAHYGVSNSFINPSKG